MSRIDYLILKENGEWKDETTHFPCNVKSKVHSHTYITVENGTTLSYILRDRAFTTSTLKEVDSLPVLSTPHLCFPHLVRPIRDVEWGSEERLGKR